jgi:hypothetical protein
MPGFAGIPPPALLKLTRSERHLDCLLSLVHLFEDCPRRRSIGRFVARPGRSRGARYETRPNIIGAWHSVNSFDGLRKTGRLH